MQFAVKILYENEKGKELRVWAPRAKDLVILAVWFPDYDPWISAWDLWTQPVT